MSSIAKKPKFASKFSSAMQADFPFLKSVDGKDSEVLCTICNSKLDISSGGRTYINKHIITARHVKAASTVNTNQTMTSFLASNPALDLLSG